MKRPKILKNAAYCKVCDEEVESVSRHDFKSCKCGRLFVDGGKDYQRLGFQAMSEWEDRSVLDPDAVPDEPEHYYETIPDLLPEEPPVVPVEPLPAVPWSHWAPPEQDLDTEELRAWPPNTPGANLLILDDPNPEPPPAAGQPAYVYTPVPDLDPSEAKEMASWSTGD
ncbi:DUF7695 domain-containing protein [Longispora urticae]